jgi:hypothetical protein
MDSIKAKSGSESVLQPYLAHVSTQQKKGVSQSVREFVIVNIVPSLITQVWQTAFG